MIEGELSYYREAGPMTAISRAHADLIAHLPTDLAGLCEVVRGVVIHPDLTALYGIEVPQERRDEERDLRSLAHFLACTEALDPRPLVQARPPEKRALGTCRSFATLLCGLLRFQGTPARSRCGFARYFLPGRGEDHWVCEVWDSSDSRWRLVDAQIDAIQQKAFGVSVDPLDLDRDQFLPGGLVWRECRTGRREWSEFGLSAIGESGMWFVIGDFVRDVAALNKVELLPWDLWGMMLGSPEEAGYTMSPEQVLAVLKPDDVAQLDRLAAQTAEAVNLEAVRLAFETDARFRVPRRITSGGPGGQHPVDLGDVLQKLPRHRSADA